MTRNMPAKRRYDLDYAKRNYARRLEANRLWKKRSGYKPDREKAIAASRKWQAANPEKVKLARRRRHFMKQYGISLEEYEGLLKEQNGRCAACGDELLGRNHLDHCHTTGIIRGILCSGCNVALGHAKDDVGRLKALIRYLNKHSHAPARPIASTRV